jgi:hypothetical protein
MDELVIPEMKSWRRLILSRIGNGHRNRRSMKRLAAWNRELKAPEDIRAALGLAERDMSFLRRLALRPDGWQPFAAAPGAPLDLERLVGLGLIRLAWPARRLRLADAGRFLLVLTEIDTAG